MHWPDFSANRTAAQEFYRSQNCSLAWIRGGAPTDQAVEMIQLLENAELKGLDPADYDAGLWTDRLANLGGGDESRPAEDLARFDLALTVSALRYVSDVHFGRFNAGLFHATFRPAADKENFSDFVRNLSHAADVEVATEAIEPQFPDYRRAEVALANYLAMLGKGEDPELPVVKTPVEPGGSYPAAAQLAHRLRRLGDLPGDIDLADDNTVYDGEIVEAVKSFQARHALEPDGRLDEKTLDQLNVPLRSRVRQLEFTLERWRWAPHHLRRPPILINIPEFRLRALNHAYDTEIAMKVVVGNAYGHQTPVFAADLTYVVFHPYWEVPRSIESNELAPKIEEDRAYLAQHDFQVVTEDGRAETPEFVGDSTLARIRSGAVHIRQMPGKQNALGPVKFVFPNNYHVYLHGTPATGLFAKTRRDFSHGCIRVERPEELAEWVLRGNPEWPAGRIRAAMRGTETLEVTVAEPIPVLIIYATAMVSKSGKALFFPDIYGEDAQLEALSTQGYPYPKWRPQETPRDGDN
jgi:murein L,D-transpeptidase YcbB/YkuD